MRLWSRLAGLVPISRGRGLVSLDWSGTFADERASFRDQLWQIIVLSAVMRYRIESVNRTASPQLSVSYLSPLKVRELSCSCIVICFLQFVIETYTLIFHCTKVTWRPIGLIVITCMYLYLNRNLYTSDATSLFNFSSSFLILLALGP